MPNAKSSAAWRELLSTFADYDELFLAGPKAVRGELAVAESYQFLATMLGLSLDVAFFSDPVAPRFVDVLTPFRHDRRWGGDNTDAYYGYAVVDPRRTYLISGAPNDSVMYSVAVYNEPEPGRGPTARSVSSTTRPCLWTPTGASRACSVRNARMAMTARSLRSTRTHAVC